MYLRTRERIGEYSLARDLVIKFATNSRIFRLIQRCSLGSVIVRSFKSSPRVPSGVTETPLIDSELPILSWSQEEVGLALIYRASSGDESVSTNLITAFAGSPEVRIYRTIRQILLQHRCFQSQSQ